MFLIAALNDLQLLLADIGNAYLNAPNREKAYAIAGKEFGSHAGERVVIVKALHGLKSAGAAWRAHLASSLTSPNYKSCLADPDIWLREANLPNGSTYYEFLAVYVDDILCISNTPQETMKCISELYRIKENSINKPERYLGADVIQYFLPDDSLKPRWGLSSHHYVTESIKNAEVELNKVGKALSNNVSTPLSTNYRPELDVSPVSSPEQVSYYQNLIRVLRWIIEFGHIDIHAHVAMLSSFLALPREGHLQEALHIFGAEFVALCITIELIESLRYKLRMMGIAIEGPCSVFCDNESVVKNSSIPESILKKKHNAIAYHHVRESAVAGIVRIGYIHRSTNLADMFTKPLPQLKIHGFCEQILY